MMSTNMPRGGAAALFMILLTWPLGAQTGGAVSARSRDSAGVVQVLVMTKGRIDTIKTLMRSFEEIRAGSPMWDSLRKQIEALMPLGIEMHRAEMMSPSLAPKGWIGINAGGVPRREELRPDGHYLTYFAYPTVVTVDGQSPADRAGILPGDLLVAYNGLNVVGRPFNLSQLLVPEKKLTITVRREGEMKDFSVTVAKVPNRVYVRRMDFDRAPLRFPAEVERQRVAAIRRSTQSGESDAVAYGRAFPGSVGSVDVGNHVFVISPNGVLGASVSTIGPALARVLKLETGVLVNDVPEESPAWKHGLRTGDVIVDAAGQPVASLSQLRDLILARAPDRSVTLRIIRDKKPQDVNVKW